MTSNTSSFTAVPTSGSAPLAVVFTATSAAGTGGTITGYLWDFGDTATSTLADPLHTYGTGGTYTVILTTFFTGGSPTIVSTAGTDIVVAPTPVNPIKLISPIYNDPQYFNNNNVGLNGGQIHQYIAGSFSGQQTTFTGKDGLVANANPIILDSSGRAETAIWLTQGLYYNLVLKDASGTIIENFDNVYGVALPVTAGNTSATSTIWNLETATPTYVNATQFFIPGALTTDFAVGNRVFWTNGDTSEGYGVVTVVTYSSPNTHVTIQPDNALLNSGLLTMSWSSLVANAITVDAGGVSYASALSYSVTGTVGNALRGLSAAISGVSASSNAATTLWPTTGSGANTPYVLTPSPSTLAYSATSNFYVEFVAASAGIPTLNVSGLGARPIKMYDNTGLLITAVIPANSISQVIYDGTRFIYLDQIPPAPFDLGSIPHGQQTILTTGTFTTPANVYSVSVICVAGGGGGANGGRSGSGEGGFTYWTGASGGNGGVAWKTIAVTPSTPYLITIGTGGAANGGHGTQTVFGASTVVASGGSPGGGGEYDPPGANGIDVSGAFGLGAGTIMAMGVLKGTGGAGGDGFSGGLAGTAGMCVITW